MLAIEGRRFIGDSKILDVASPKNFTQCCLLNLGFNYPVDYDLITALEKVKAVYEDFCRINDSKAFSEKYFEMTQPKELDGILQAIADNVGTNHPQTIDDLRDYICEPIDYSVNVTAIYKPSKKSISAIAKCLKANFNADIVFENGNPQISFTDLSGIRTQIPLNRLEFGLQLDREDCRDYYECDGMFINFPLSKDNENYRFTLLTELTPEQKEILRPATEHFTEVDFPKIQQENSRVIDLCYTR